MLHVVGLSDFLALNARFVTNHCVIRAFEKGVLFVRKIITIFFLKTDSTSLISLPQYFILLIIGLTSGISALLIIAFTFILADYSLMIVFAILLCCEMVGVVLSMRLMNRFLAFLRAIYPRNVLIPQSYEQWMGSRSI